jgi:hypothetical protein
MDSADRVPQISLLRPGNVDWIAPNTNSMRAHIGGLFLAVFLIGTFRSADSLTAENPPLTTIPQSEAISFAESMQTLPDWRFHPGDDPAYAQPAYDDSHWTPISLAAPRSSHDPFFSSSSYLPGWTARGFPGLHGYAWYRTHLNVNAADAELWLEMPPDVDDGYQVYANGQPIGSMGHFSAGQVVAFYSRPEKFLLPPPGPDGSIDLALRFFMAPDTVLWNFGAGGMHSAPVIGLGPSVALLHQRNSNEVLHTSLVYLVLGIIALVACLAALSIYANDRSEPVYLWLTLALAAEATLYIVSFLAAETYLISLNSFAILNELLGSAIGPMFWLLFWIQWFGIDVRRRILRAALLLAGLETLIVFSLHQPLLGTLLPLAWMHGVWQVFTLFRLAFAFLLVAVTVGGIRRNRTEGWIAVPAVVLLGITLFVDDLEVLGVPVSYFPFGIRLSIQDISLFALILVVLGLAIRRFLQSKARQRELMNDLEQAHEIQSLLIPEQVPQMPGYRVEGTYLPASQVGGDFYQVLPLQEGGLLLLLGDVSGKGLRAAMLVSMVVGAVRTIVKQTSRPDEILTRLNQEMTGNLKSGFVTCVCTRVAPSGAVTIANAGHLPPWVNKDEIALPGTLPLGITADARYTTEVLQLGEGDRLTLLSDGVVEARLEKDGALFGFDRLKTLFADNPSAEMIAREAQRFGQEDDISVLSITRLKTDSSA